MVYLKLIVLLLLVFLSVYFLIKSKDSFTRIILSSFIIYIFFSLGKFFNIPYCALLALFSRIAFYTFLLVYFIISKNKQDKLLAVSLVLYLFFMYFFKIGMLHNLFIIPFLIPFFKSKKRSLKLVILVLIDVLNKLI